MTAPLAPSPVFDDLPETLPLRRYGYQVLRPGGDPAQFLDLKRRFAEHLRGRLQAFTGKELASLTCEGYHEALTRLGAEHHGFIKATTRRLPSEWIAHPFLQGLLAAAGRLVGKPLRLYADSLEFRVVRPGQPDNNPWHRDHWFSYFAPLVNVYLPLSGSYCDSSLQVVPFSHLWTDEEVVPAFQAGQGKTRKGDVLYSVPEIKSCSRPIQGHRMDILPGDFALFSPRMVHGEGTNASPETRFSFEFRLEVAV